LVLLADIAFPERRADAHCITARWLASIDEFA
jgi:hypothetical protein